MSKAKIELPPKLIPVFTGKARYRGAWGGRGSGKTKAFAKMSAVVAYMRAAAGEEGVILCGREYMNSLEDSSMEEVKSAIRSEPWLAAQFDIGEKYIRTKCRRVSYVFAGLRHNLDSIKSKANILIAWVDEAETVSDAAWRKLLPTVRTKGSEIWISWNPENPESATNKRFYFDPPEGSKIVKLNWQDNPWWNDELNNERLNDLRKNPDFYDHIWEGEFLSITDAQIFKGAFEIKEFEPDYDYGEPLHGIDFGFAQDPTTCVQVYVKDNCLYIRRECGKVGLELDETAQYISDHIQSASKYVIRADSARPESISYLSRHGLPSIEGVEKWKGSVEDGIAHIRSYDRVYIHPECEQTAREFRNYSYKVDPRTDDILPVVVDKFNHYIDACFSGDTEVVVNGELMKFRDIPSQGVITGYDGSETEYFNGGLIRSDSLCRVILDSGDSVECTPDHEFLTTEGWCRAENLSGKTLCESSLFQTNSSLSVPTNANLHGEDSQESITSKEGVQRAASRSLSTNTQKLKTVVEVVHKKGEHETYCVTVPKGGCFSLPSGIIVSNCRYALAPMIKGEYFDWKTYL